MNEKELEKELDNVLAESGIVTLIFSMTQDLLQTKKGKEEQALNIIMGSSFALLNAINNYKEIKNGKSKYNRIRTADCEDGSRFS